MIPRRQWVFSPQRGGKSVPGAVQQRVEARLQQYAAQSFAGSYTRLATRFHGQFCYIDAYLEPEPPGPGWPPPDWPETRERYLDRLRNTPLHLCRLRYFGDEERWGFAFYTYSNERYEMSVFSSGDFFGLPEEALELAAQGSPLSAGHG
ncbi:MAG: hypothetical protein ACRDHX_03865 [Chloroflexota bacterium]